VSAEVVSISTTAAARGERSFEARGPSHSKAGHFPPLKYDGPITRTINNSCLRGNVIEKEYNKATRDAFYSPELGPRNMLDFASWSQGITRQAPLGGAPIYRKRCISN
jgi:hypothetical protein